MLPVEDEWLSGGEGEAAKDSGRESLLSKITESLETKVREGIQLRWQELRAVEVVWEEIADEFDGEHPARPEARQTVVDAKARLVELNREAEGASDKHDLPDPTEEQIDLTRQIVERVVPS